MMIDGVLAWSERKRPKKWKLLLLLWLLALVLLLVNCLFPRREIRLHKEGVNEGPGPKPKHNTGKELEDTECNQPKLGFVAHPKSAFARSRWQHHNHNQQMMQVCFLMRETTHPKDYKPQHKHKMLASATRMPLHLWTLALLKLRRSSSLPLRT